MTQFRISRQDLAGLVRSAETRLGISITDALTGSASQVAQKVFESLEPKLADIVRQAAEASEPTIRTVVREEVVPKVSLALGASVLVGAVIAAFVGAWFASRKGRSA